jgi:hypothetical protein
LTLEQLKANYAQPPPVNKTLFVVPPTDNDLQQISKEPAK